MSVPSRSSRSRNARNSRSRIAFPVPDGPAALVGDGDPPVVLVPLALIL